MAQFTIISLIDRKDFLRLRNARKRSSPYFMLRYAPSDVPLPEGMLRVGYTVTTKCGNAVTRNRIKRRLRALVRELMPIHGRAGVDYNFIALANISPSAADAPYDALRDAMARTLASAQA
jgi:ribonuclease P protein component